MKSDDQLARNGLAPMSTWLSEPLASETAKAITRLRRAPDVVRVAVMPDVHLAEQVCIGIALATRSLVYPQAVGGDIGCGLTAIALDINASALDHPGRRFDALHALQQAAPILRHVRASAAPPLPPDLSPHDLSCDHLVNAARRDGGIQRGTLGRGNHFLEIQADETDRLWLTVHSGSREIGQTIAAHHLRWAARAAGGLRFLDTGTPEGAAYLNDAIWAERYAAANRDFMIDRAIEYLRPIFGLHSDDASRFGTSHNHVRCERHFDMDLLVHRKGASPATEATTIIIPGSMASPTYHAIGRGKFESLASSSHGAGRALSRTEARRTISSSSLHAQTAGVAFDPRLSRHLVEEAPAAYRDVRKVMRAQRDLVRIERTLRTIVCHKGA